MSPKDLAGILTFLKNAEQLKNTIRSGYTSEGRQESVAEHTWRLCLMAVLFENEFLDLNFEKLIKICLIHDLGEIIGGDIPAPDQTGATDKADNERKDFLKLIDPLPKTIQQEFRELWDEYEEAATPEAKIAKALDKLETILQHNQGDNPPGFDYRFNLDYGKKYTGDHPLIIQIREILDHETVQRVNESTEPK